MVEKPLDDQTCIIDWNAFAPRGPRPGEGAVCDDEDVTHHYVAAPRVGVRSVGESDPGVARVEEPAAASASFAAPGTSDEPLPADAPPRTDVRRDSTESPLRELARRARRVSAAVRAWPRLRTFRSPRLQGAAAGALVCSVGFFFAQLLGSEQSRGRAEAPPREASGQCPASPSPTETETQSPEMNRRVLSAHETIALARNLPEVDRAKVIEKKEVDPEEEDVEREVGEEGRGVVEREGEEEHTEEGDVEAARLRLRSLAREALLAQVQGRCAVAQRAYERLATDDPLRSVDPDSGERARTFSVLFRASRRACWGRGTETDEDRGSEGRHAAFGTRHGGGTAKEVEEK